MGLPTDSPATDPHIPKFEETKPPMNTVTPWLSFDGHAEEATRFYVSLLPDPRIDRVMRSPIETPGGPPGSVLTVEFTLAGRPYAALNTPGFEHTGAVSFMVTCENQAEIDRLWAALLAGGGSEIQCGWLQDRWGVYWQITPARLMELINDPDRERARRAMEAMVKMVKIDIAGIERAVAGA